MIFKTYLSMNFLRSLEEIPTKFSVLLIVYFLFAMNKEVNLVVWFYDGIYFLGPQPSSNYVKIKVY